MAAMGKYEVQVGPHIEASLDVAENEAWYQSILGAYEGGADPRSCPADCSSQQFSYRLPAPTQSDAGFLIRR